MNMNSNQETVVYLLCSSIRRKKVNNNNIHNVNWRIIFEMSKEQDIYTLLYPVIKNLHYDIKPAYEIMDEWKKRTILASLNQVKNTNKMSFVLKVFNEAEIPVIALKGLALRKLYPVEELRTMSDSDILIHVGDLDKAKKILLNSGYFEDHRDLKHAIFLHKQYNPIELHWLLVDTDCFKNANYLEEDIWKNTEISNICGTTILVPSIENQMVHLCLHMAVHFVSSGFGLRQLSDLVLLVESKRNEINWNSFYEKIKKCKIESFVIAIFEVCRRLFAMVVPDILYNKELENSQYIDMIIDNVFSKGVYGGIFGKANLYPLNENLLSYYRNKDQSNSFMRKLKYILVFFFPKHHNLGKRYNYVQKYPMLIPIAWLHRMIYGIIRKDYNIEQKKLILLPESEFLRKRDNLFKWLNL
ncbi:nucleotidyltransferase family protein [Clostridium sp. JS66]|uniref:nucleotidyltransferase domain-containing protein n=1 Tax=Clostridium sp. JS66 TaxID=3064705 RepID=UPI00298D7F9D|nr:nucleotidyltransferase family protein [Clostridium sp. JS66]WPC43291.1 nucleotidyltransferase family protein [Clostridium sp. JS66]